MKETGGLKRRHFAWVAAGYLALVAYGSFVPLQFEPRPFSQVVRVILARGLYVQSRSDLVANVVLAVPLGFLLAGLWATGRSRAADLASVPLSAGLCAVVAGAIELAQVCFPPRTASLADMIAQSAGGALGGVVWVVRGREWSLAWQRLWGQRRRAGLAAGLLFPYVGLLVLLHVLPLDFTLSPADLYHKYRGGQIRLVPFLGVRESSADLVQGCVWTIAHLVPMGLLLGLSDVVGRKEGPFVVTGFSRSKGRLTSVRTSRLSVLLVGGAIAGGLELLQLFVLSRFFDTADILVGALAVVAGWELAQRARLVVQRSPDRCTQSTAGLRRTRGRAVQGETFGPHRCGVSQIRVRPCWPTWTDRPWFSAAAIAFFLVGWLALLAVSYWYPFDFDVAGGFSGERLSRLYRIPFADYYWLSYDQAFGQLLTRLLLYVPLGVLLAYWCPSRRRDGGMIGPVAAAVIVAVLLEAGQMLLPSRTPGVTDVFVGGAGAWIGALVIRRGGGHPAAGRLGIADHT